MKNEPLGHNCGTLCLTRRSGQSVMIGNELELVYLQPLGKKEFGQADMKHCYVIEIIFQGKKTEYRVWKDVPFKIPYMNGAVQVTIRDNPRGYFDKYKRLVVSCPRFIKVYRKEIYNKINRE